ncbi:MAG TPA: YceI family protein [Nannocystaceae bacterium]|nr:YceI family protein [Nannocystaceae bacterium]
MPKYDAQSARAEVFTFKEGLFSAMGHDLRIAVTAFQVTVDDQTHAISATFDAHSLRVVGPAGGGSLSDKDRREIEHNIADEVLDARRYPTIRFTSTRVTPRGEGFEIAGDLELHGQRRAITFTTRREGQNQIASITLHQPDYGIKPYRAPLGVLKIKPDVRVELSLPA